MIPAAGGALWHSAPVWFVAAGPLGVALGALVGSALLVAALPVLFLYPAYWHALRGRTPAGVLGLSLLWAACLSAAVVGWTLLAPSAAAAVVWNAEAYRAEMFEWLRTGAGPEGDPRQFLPIHATHFAAFCVLSLASAGGLGLLLGSVLMGYMSVYVGAIALAAGSAFPAVLLAWHPWSVLRVVGFVACGIALSMPLRVGRLDALPRRLLAAGFGLVVLDAFVKALLAEPWRGLLKSLTGL
jgi:hypothetical protein